MVSIVIPNYNNEAYLAKCIESILKQSFTDFEVVVVDDCSKDNSVAIIEEYKRRDERIKIIRNASREGVASSRHKGIISSKGSWITTLDSDDIFINKRKIQKEYSLAEAKRLAGHNPIVFSKIILIDKNGNRLGVQPGYISEGNIFQDIITRKCMIPRDFLFTKEQYMMVGGFDFSLPIYEDWDLKIRLADRFPFFYSGEEGVGYRRHGSGLSSVPLKKHLIFLNKVFLKNYFLIKSNKLKNTALFYKFLGRMIFKNIKLRSIIV